MILDVRTSGSKSFYLYKKIAGKPERVLLGRYPDMKIPEARKKAAIVKGEIAHGKNPQEERRSIRQEITFGDFFREYMERYSKQHKKTWKSDEVDIPRHLGHWFKRKLSSISKHEIQRAHEEIGRNHGTYQANRMHARIQGIYNKAIEWGWQGENPAKGIKKFKEKARDRFIQPNELPLLFQALEAEENETAKDYILLSLMTGARKANMLAMRWADIRWSQRIWYIPETKNGEPVSVPLIPQALELLERRKAQNHQEWVFEGTGSNGHLADPKKSWNRVRQRATLALWKQTPTYAALIETTETQLRTQNNYGFTILKLYNTVQKAAAEQGITLPTGLMDVRLHDLRRTFGSYQAITGASLSIIGKTLGHKSPSATAIYARLHDDPVRAAMEKAANAMFETGEKHAG